MLRKTILFCATMLMFSVGAATAEPINSSVSAPQQTQNLFVLLSKQGILKKISEQQYLLTLKNVNNTVIFFTDRPVRKTGLRPLESFIKAWTVGSFKDVPPNAVMEAVHLNDKVELTKKTVDYAFVLSNPQYIAAKHQLTFNVQPLNGQKMPEFSVRHSEDVAVFIDDVGSCGDCLGMAF